MTPITTDMLFEHHVKKIIEMIKIENKIAIDIDMEANPEHNPDLFTWLQNEPEEVGIYFMQYLVDYGFTNSDFA